MAREVFSVKIKAKLKKEFTETVKEKGFSTCFIIETLLTAWLEGVKVAPRGKVDFGPTNVPPVVVNQSFTRVVKRGARRGTSGFRDSFSESEPNFYDGRTNIWEHRPGPCNLNSHAAGCACSQCRE